VIRNHRRAAYGEEKGYEKLATPPVPLDLKAISDSELAEAAKRAWDDALNKGKEHGFRNAQATVIAPTGTIGLVMDCDTTGVEPDFALVKFKTLAGGGYFKIINRCVPEALSNLGYGQAEIDAIVAYAVGHGTLEDYQGRINLDALRGKGFGEEQIGQIEAALEAGAHHLLLDNMNPATLRAAVEQVAGRVPTEASGGVNLDTIAAKAASGVDYISVGRLTQSAPAADIGLDFKPV